MSNEPIPTETQSNPAAAAASDAQKLAQDAWQPAKLLDACVGAETDKAIKIQVVRIIQFHRLALKEFKNSPDRKRLAGQTALRKIRQLLPHRSPEKLQRLLNATAEQLTASGSVQ